MKLFLSIFSISLALLCIVCVQAVDKSACGLPMVTGPCRAAGKFFYYDTGAKACQQFIYGGCQGNDNRFRTKEECESLCL